VRQLVLWLRQERIELPVAIHVSDVAPAHCAT
jgi:hypothetical protein